APPTNGAAKGMRRDPGDRGDDASKGDTMACLDIRETPAKGVHADCLDAHPEDTWSPVARPPGSRSSDRLHPAQRSHWAAPKLAGAAAVFVAEVRRGVRG